MENKETLECFENVKESFIDTQLENELAFLTPRDIQSTIDSWATYTTDKEKVRDMVTKWLELYKEYRTDIDLTHDEKFTLLMKTHSNAREILTGILKKRDKEQEAIDRKKFQELTEDEQTKYLNDMPIVARGEEHGKCDISEYKDNMEWILNNIIPLNTNKQTRLLNLLTKMGYNHTDELNGYIFLTAFFSELLWCEFYICKEIAPYKDELISFKRYKHTPEDKIWEKRLQYYKEIGERNKYRHSATINSTKWAIPFDDFAKLYRTILGLSNKAITSPIK